jgi:hypothetical protein
MKATLFLIDIALREKTAILEPWMVGILVLIFAGHAWIRVNYPRRLANLFNALINVRMMRQMMREELALSHRASIILIGQFFLIVSLFIYTALTFFQVDIIPGSGFGLYLKILFIIILMYLVKALTITLIKLISDGDFGLTEYNFMVFLTNKFLGLVLLPLLILASVWPTHVVTSGVEQGDIYNNMRWPNTDCTKFSHSKREGRWICTKHKGALHLHYFVPLHSRIFASCIACEGP